MVACQNNHVLGQINCLCHLQDHLIEVLGHHAGVAAELVDLIGGSLDQNGLVQHLCAAQCDLQCQFIGGTVGRDAAANTCAALFHHNLKRMFHDNPPEIFR